jgi:hypothetical protein
VNFDIVRLITLIVSVITLALYMRVMVVRPNRKFIALNLAFVALLNAIYYAVQLYSKYAGSSLAEELNLDIGASLRLVTMIELAIVAAYYLLMDAAK